MYLADESDGGRYDLAGGREYLDLRVSHLRLALDEEGGLLAHRDLLQSIARQVDAGGVHHGTLERRSGHVLPVELQLHDVRLGVLTNTNNKIHSFEYWIFLKAISSLNFELNLILDFKIQNSFTWIQTERI